MLKFILVLIIVAVIQLVVLICMIRWITRIITKEVLDTYEEFMVDKWDKT